MNKDQNKEFKEFLEEKLESFAIGQELNSNSSVGKCTLSEIIKTHYNGNKEALLNDLNAHIDAKKCDCNANINTSDITSLLTSKKNKTKWKIRSEIIQDCYRKMYPMDSDELIHMSEFKTGREMRLMMRKNLPGIIPSEETVESTKKLQRQMCQAVWRPERTSTGVRVCPIGVVQVIEFRYPYLQGTLHLRFTGDGREIGKTKHTFLATTVLNHELYLYGDSYQSRDTTFPIQYYAGGDSGDNNLMNLTKPTNCVDEYLKRNDNVTGWLSADEMYVQAVLAPNGELSPSSNEHSNIYAYTHKNDNSKTATSGKRTDMVPLFDRTNSDRIFTEIDMKHVIPDAPVHGTTRSVETLINLEKDIAWNEGSKLVENNSEFTGADAVERIPANINERDLSNRPFKIDYDEKTGKPKYIKLNKEAARGILYYPTEDETVPDVPLLDNDANQTEYDSFIYKSNTPTRSSQDSAINFKSKHVLDGVVSKQRKTVINLPIDLKDFLKLPNELSDFKLVCLIWESWSRMLEMISHEPTPRLIQGKIKGSKDVNDYSWGYSMSDIKEYKFHCERYYQLFCIRYTSTKLTPYMIKMIDYIPYFMEHTEFPINRFATEGSENMNYRDQQVYHHRTMRHGGKYRQDISWELMLNFWRRISYKIKYESLDKNAGHMFAMFCKKSRAAVVFQKHIRGFLFRRSLYKNSFIFKPHHEKNLDEILHNRLVVKNMFPIDTLQSQSTTFVPIFHGKVFVLCGRIIKNSRWNDRSSLESIIKRHGGIIRSKLPKSESARPYILIYEKDKGKVPCVVKCGLRKYNVKIVTFNFVYESLNHEKCLPESDFLTDLGNLRKKIKKDITVFSRFSNKHKRHSTLTSRLKHGRHRNRPTVLKFKQKMNIALFYGHFKRKQLGKFSFSETSEWNKVLCKRWTQLDKTSEEYLDIVKRYQAYTERLNEVTKPSYEATESRFYKSMSNLTYR